MKDKTKTIDADKVKGFLTDQGRKQRWLAEQAGVIEVTVSVWFRTGNIPFNNGERIAEALGVSLEEILV